MYIAVDVSSILWTALKAGKDKEGMLDEDGNHCNSAGYGYENAINSAVRVLQELNCVPSQLILVEEGYNSKSPRLNIDPNYKATRGKKSKLEYDNFNTLKKMFLSALKGVGALVVRQDNAEGDDVLAWLAKHTERELVIMTNDGDLTVLNGGLVTVRVNGVMGVNKYGDWPCRYVTLYKAMVGDSSDNISGIRGFGPKAWEQLVVRFGIAGMDVLVKCALDGSVASLREDSEKDAFVKKIYDGGADFIRSYKLACVYPEWVDTMTDPIQFEPGMVGETKDERLKQWSAVKQLVTADKWDEFVQRALPQFGDWFALDIETSMPPESDAWLLAQPRADEDDLGVDVIGSRLSGMSLTFGKNHNITVYIPVDHADTDNVSTDQLRDFLAAVFAKGSRPVIHNVAFEGVVLYNLWGKDWANNGWEGYLPNWIENIFCASYVDENDKLKLKHLSKRWLGYEQVDYKTTTTVNDVQYKMRELSAAHVFSYAADDTICTAALFNFFRTFMMLEHTWDVCERVEIAASYLHVQSFVHGFKFDLAKMRELEAEDEKTYKAAIEALQPVLVAKQWDGTVGPQYAELSAAAVKQAYHILTGRELKTAVRTVSKLIDLMEDRVVAGLFAGGDLEEINRAVREAFKPVPEFNPGSSVQLKRLLYETFELPVKVYNKPTPVMKQKGIKQGAPSTDALAFAYAMRDTESEEIKSALQNIRLLKMVSTRKGLYYSAYPYFVHWLTGSIHSSHRQCSTNTRRASSAKPNTQQLPKHPKIEGQAARFREVMIPHKPGAVIVSMDFAAQEMRVIADYSKDENLLACYIGDVRKDMHTLTGLGILNSEGVDWTYEEFEERLSNEKHPDYKKAKAARALGKKLNFTAEYGAAAAKVAATLMITEEEAQRYLDAREANFAKVQEWKQGTIAEANGTGIVRTKLGAVRHLKAAIMSSDRSVSSKAERQSVNTKVQGSSAEMTKLAEGRMWEARLEQRFDAQIIGPVHDEVIASCTIADLVPFCQAMHACMIAPYADMFVPIESSISFGPSFGEQHEIGNLPTEEAIKAGLQACGYTV